MKKLYMALCVLTMICLLVSCTNTADVSSVTSSKPNTVSSDRSVSSTSVSSQSVSSVDTMPLLGKKNDYSETVYPLGTYAGCVKVMGRYTLVGQDQSAISCDWTGSGIEFAADCEGDVKLEMTVHPFSTDEYRRDSYFTVVVDGTKQDRLLVEGPTDAVGDSVQTVTLAEGLAKGKHTISIARQHEAYFGNISLNKLILNGVLDTRPKDKELYIEFVGDSITAGYGDLLNFYGTQETKNMPLNQDGTQTYAYLAAQKLDADYSVLATSGSTAIGYNDGMWYNLAAYKRNKNFYSFPRKADIVVINLGTNETGKNNSAVKNNTPVPAGCSPEQFAVNGKILIETVKKKNPDAKIVWAYGLMGDDYGVHIKTMLDSLGGAAAGYYYCPLTKNMGGGGSHPNLAGHEVAGTELSAFIKNEVLKK